VDYDAVKVRSNVRMNGVFLKEGENVEYVDPETGLSKMDQLEDEAPLRRCRDRKQGDGARVPTGRSWKRSRSTPSSMRLATADSERP